MADVNAEVQVSALKQVTKKHKDRGAYQAEEVAVAAAGQDSKFVTSADQSAADADLTNAPAAGLKIVLDSVVISAGSAMTVTLKEETTNTVLAEVLLPINGTAAWNPGLKLPTADKKIKLRTSAAGQVRATAVYHSEA